MIINEIVDRKMKKKYEKRGFQSIVVHCSQKMALRVFGIIIHNISSRNGGILLHKALSTPSFGRFFTIIDWKSLFITGSDNLLFDCLTEIICFVKIIFYEF